MSNETFSIKIVASGNDLPTGHPDALIELCGLMVTPPVYVEFFREREPRPATGYDDRSWSTAQCNAILFCCHRHGFSPVSAVDHPDAPIPKTSESFSLQLKAIREREGLTQAVLATRLGYKTPNPIAEFESGRRRPTWDTLCRLADALSVSLNAFRAKNT